MCLFTAHRHRHWLSRHLRLCLLHVWLLFSSGDIRILFSIVLHPSYVGNVINMPTCCHFFQTFYQGGLVGTFLEELTVHSQILSLWRISGKCLVRVQKQLRNGPGVSLRIPLLNIIIYTCDFPTVTRQNVCL